MSILGLLAAVMAVFGLLFLLGAAALSVQRIRRAVRLVPRLPTAAPVSWLWQLTRPAHLHRRLRRTCRAVAAVLGPLPRPTRRWLRRVEPPTSPLLSAAEEFLEASDRVDRQLVLIGQLPVRLRQPVAGELAATVQRLERLGDRLVRVSLAWDAQLDEAGSPWDGPVSDRPNDVADRLTALEQTLRDLRLLA